MADDADLAEERTSVALAATVAKVSSSPPEAPYLGYCLSCGETTSPKTRWCDVECREDWSETLRKELLASRRLGIK